MRHWRHIGEVDAVRSSALSTATAHDVSKYWSFMTTCRKGDGNPDVFIPKKFSLLGVKFLGMVITPSKGVYTHCDPIVKNR